MKGIIYYTDNRLDPEIMELCQKQLLEAGLPIVSVTLKPIDFGKNIHLPLERGIETYFTQIYTALLASTSEYIFFCEHDCLYPKSHFEFTPPTKDKFYYNHNWVKIDWPYTKAVSWGADQVSGLCVSRELALEHYKKMVDRFDRETFNRSYEPESGNSGSWMSPDPYVDIRHSTAMTKSKWSIADFRDKSTAKNFKEVNLPEWAKLIIGGE